MAELALGDGRLDELLGTELLVPVRSSGGRELDAAGVPLDEMRHGSDQAGRFLAAYTDESLFREYGPAGSDLIRVWGRELIKMAAAAGERILVDPGAPEQRELPAELVARTAAAADASPRLTGPGAPGTTAAGFRRPPPPPELSPPGDVPATLPSALRSSLEQLPQVERAWLLRRGEGWNIGIQQSRDATLSDFDEVRNRLHAVGTQQLGTRRLLAVTDLRAPSLRRQYAAMAPPFYERAGRRGLLDRLFGG